jgi:hypothetical protein
MRLLLLLYIEKIREARSFINSKHIRSQLSLSVAHRRVPCANICICSPLGYTQARTLGQRKGPPPPLRWRPAGEATVQPPYARRYVSSRSRSRSPLFTTWQHCSNAVGKRQSLPFRSRRRGAKDYLH